MAKELQNLEYPLPDSVKNNWVNARAPKWFVPYLRLSRLDRPIGTWLLLLPCWWGCLLAVCYDGTGFRLFDLWILIGCALGAILMRGAGCTWNDIIDKDLDSKVERTRDRPIPSKSINLLAGYSWLVLQLLLAFFILITYNKAAIIVGLCSLIPVLVYPFAKRFTWWPQVFLGIAFNWGILFAWAAHNGSIESPAILLYLAGIFWTLFYDTIYAHQDIEDDLLIGIKSTAIFFGESTKKWLGVFIILICFFFITAIIDTFEIAYQHKEMMICTVGIIIFGFHLIWQAFRVDIKNWASCLHVFRSNRDAGLIIVLFLIIACIL